ncbi:MAG: hypothetical protein HXX15_08270 [Rhodopseudomonas sp.]|uniref:hypothetical protein n=1 Tax=Rhodopseudomonas sp. TaxID=1078 RepID=UPI0017E7049B|nr:hypothetical protein [Rhodopseudomonas sp.]NVN86073.1 hypothetical protein [Rhodopseudomonas sp.]
MAVVLLAKANTDARLGDSTDSVSIDVASEGFRPLEPATRRSIAVCSRAPRQKHGDFVAAL